MEALTFWLDKPFDPRRARKPARRGRTVVLRYTGSIGRAAVKALIVFALLAVLTSVIGDRAGQDLDAHEVASSAGIASAQR
jgi:hypothetical protein